jgi:hypothetical protein
MSDQDNIYDAAHALLPETYQILGEEKLKLLVADALADRPRMEDSFATPEHGHPAHFIEEIKLAIEAISALVAILKAVNRIQDIVRQQGDEASTESHAAMTRYEHIKSTLIHLIRNIK